MDFLPKDCYELKVDKINDYIQISIKIINENFYYKGILPKKIRCSQV